MSTVNDHVITLCIDTAILGLQNTAWINGNGKRALELLDQFENIKRQRQCYVPDPRSVLTYEDERKQFSSQAADYILSGHPKQLTCVMCCLDSKNDRSSVDNPPTFASISECAATDNQGRTEEEITLIVQGQQQPETQNEATQIE